MLYYLMSYFIKLHYVWKYIFYKFIHLLIYTYISKCILYT